MKRGAPLILLNEQYRTIWPIYRIASAIFYENRVKTHVDRLQSRLRGALCPGPNMKMHSKTMTGTYRFTIVPLPASDNKDDSNGNKETEDTFDVRNTKVHKTI